MEQLKKVKVAVIGVGNMGAAHIDVIKTIDNMQVVALCDIDKERADKIAKKADVSVYYDYKTLFKEADIDAVIVATPHYDHTTIGIAALKAGFHLLVEKPISVHKQDCQKLIKAHTNKKQIFAAMFNQRTNPHYKKLKQLIDTNALGKITRINWIITDWFRTESYYKSGGWRATWSGEGGGVLLNQCPHQLDLLTWLFGMPSTVRANIAIGKYHDIEVEDEVTTYLEYPNGATGIFITSTGEAPGTNRFEVTGTMGKVVIEGSDGITFVRNEVPCDEHSLKSSAGFAPPELWNVKIPIDGCGSQHEGILRNFANAIVKGEDLIAPASEGINSVELANAMLYSGMLNKTVTMPLSASGYAKKLKELIATSKPKKEVVKINIDDFEDSF